jgi:OOP family OmpA-OmpF porin
MPDTPPTVAETPKPIAEPIKPLEARLSEDKVTLSGDVLDDAMRDRLVTRAEAVYGAGNVVDQLTIADAGASAEWLRGVDAFFPPDLKDAKDAFARYDGQTVVLEGAVDSAATRENTEQRLSQTLGSGVPIDNRLTVVEAAPPPVEPLVPEETVKDEADLQAQLNKLLAERVIEFEVDSDLLTPVGAALLDEVTPLLKQLPDVRFTIEGHTDNRGKQTLNERLSERRASIVKEYLIKQGIEAERMSAVGYGAAHPIADNTTKEGRRKNRRIQFKVGE